MHTLDREITMLKLDAIDFVLNVEEFILNAKEFIAKWSSPTVWFQTMSATICEWLTTYNPFTSKSESQIDD